MLPIEVMNATSQSFVHKRILGAVGGFISGGPVGAASGFLTAGGGSRTGVSRSDPRSIQPPRPGTPRKSFPVIPTPGLRGLAERALPGGKTGFQVDIGAVSSNGCPSGFHPNKSDYHTSVGFVAEGTKCVKNRRRNLSNGRANTRALRRMSAWDKQERKLAKTLKAIARGR